MALIPDELAKTVKIPVRIVKGRITYFYGGPMPRLKEGTVGDLVLATCTVTGATGDNLEAVAITPAGTLLAFGIDGSVHRLDSAHTWSPTVGATSSWRVAASPR